MRLPLVSRVRRAARHRALLWKNPDLRRVFLADGPHLRRDPETPAPLSPAQVAHWNDFGFLVLRRFFEPSVIEAYRRHIDDAWRGRARPGNPLVMFSARGGHYFRDATDDDRSQTYRLLDQYLIDAPTRRICMDTRLTGILHQLMGHAPVVCNSLLFEWGSEQDLHSDMFYMPPISENQMLATWLAIDDVTEDNGPLLYVPGSHKLTPHRFSNGKVAAVTEEVAGAVAAIQARMAERGLATERFLANSGDLLIWHSQLMHGGDTIRDRSARRTSLVTHYYSTCDVSKGPYTCAETKEGALFLMKSHVPIAQDGAQDAAQ